MVDIVYTMLYNKGCSMAKGEQINIRMTDEEKKQLQKDAQEQERTVSNLLLWCWKEWRKVRGKKHNEGRSSAS